MSFGKAFQSAMLLAGNAFYRKDFKHLGLFNLMRDLVLYFQLM